MVANPASFLIAVLDRFNDGDFFVGGVGVLCGESCLSVLHVNGETTPTRCTVVLVWGWCLGRKEDFLPTSADDSLSLFVVDFDEDFSIFCSGDVTLPVVQVT